MSNVDNVFAIRTSDFAMFSFDVLFERTLLFVVLAAYATFEYRTAFFDVRFELT